MPPCGGANSPVRACPFCLKYTSTESSGSCPVDVHRTVRQPSHRYPVRIRQISSQCPAIVRLVSQRDRSSIPPVSDGIAHRYPVLG